MTKVAIMGYGVVGSGLIELIDKNREKNKCDIVITSILVKNKEIHLNSSHEDLITTESEEFFAAESEIVVELIGGIDAAYTYVKRALSLKKHVVTANKDLIAQYGEELFQLAKNNNVSLKFEASVGGGIPIIKPLTETLQGVEISSIKAILNGTTNFILTKMANENLDYEIVLKEAQELGFAEANPESDVMGYDAARKLAILTTLAFDNSVNWNDINIKGITEIDNLDLEYANKFNCKIKLLCEAVRCSNGIYASVKPTLIDNNSILAKVNNEVNAITIKGDEIGELLFIGKGAGKLPTGSVVYGDIIDIIHNRYVDINSFNSPRAELINYCNKTCNGIIRVKTLNKEAMIEKARETFNNFKVIDRSKDDEVALFVECTSEAYVNTFIDKVKESQLYINHKIMVMI